MILKQSGNTDEPRQQMIRGIPQRGKAGLSGAGICIPEQPAKTRCVPLLKSVQLCHEWRDEVVC